MWRLFDENTEKGGRNGPSHEVTVFILRFGAQTFGSRS